MIDSHAHLYDEAFQKDLDDVLERAREAGVERIVVPATNRETSERAIELAERYPFLYAAVGIHPHEAGKAMDSDLAAIEELLHHPRVVAVGEIGLDYYYDFAPRETQQSVFGAQLELAVKSNLPVIVHTRDSMTDAIQAIAGTVAQHPTWCQNSQRAESARRGVFHCFTGDGVQANRLFELGFFISFPGIVTFKKSSAGETIRALGLSRVLMETDSPYLTPVPYRGKRNEPAYLVLIARRIAEILGVSVEDVVRRTSANAESLFLFTIELVQLQKKNEYRV